MAKLLTLEDQEQFFTEDGFKNKTAMLNALAKHVIASEQYSDIDTTYVSLDHDAVKYKLNCIYMKAYLDKLNLLREHLDSCIEEIADKLGVEEENNNDLPKESESLRFPSHHEIDDLSF